MQIFQHHTCNGGKNANIIGIIVLMQEVTVLKGIKFSEIYLVCLLCLLLLLLLPLLLLILLPLALHPWVGCNLLWNVLHFIWQSKNFLNRVLTQVS